MTSQAFSIACYCELFERIVDPANDRLKYIRELARLVIKGYYQGIDVSELLQLIENLIRTKHDLSTLEKIYLEQSRNILFDDMGNYEPAPSRRPKPEMLSLLLELPVAAT